MRTRGVAVRAGAVLLLLALTAAACADEGIGVDDLEQAIEGLVEDLGEPVDDAPEGAADETQGSDPSASEEVPDEQPGPEEGTAEEAEPADDAPAVDVPDDRAGTGAACRAYLRPDIPRLVVEVAHQAGAAPQSGAVDHLLGTLRGVVDKPGGVDLDGPREVPGGARTWTAGELRAFAAEHRRHYSSAEQTAMFVLSVRGGFERAGVLGVAFSATEFVLFPDNIGDLTTSLLGGRGAIERAVLVHEAGHLLCLVNITYTSDIDHEDPENPNHSIHRDSVMYWAIPNDAISQVFTGPPPADFHPDDLADLQGLREGRY